MVQGEVRYFISYSTHTQVRKFNSPYPYPCQHWEGRDCVSLGQISLDERRQDMEAQLKALGDLQKEKYERHTRAALEGMDILDANLALNDVQLLTPNGVLASIVENTSVTREKLKRKGFKKWDKRKFEVLFPRQGKLDKSLNTILETTVSLKTMQAALPEIQYLDLQEMLDKMVDKKLLVEVGRSKDGPHYMLSDSLWLLHEETGLAALGGWPDSPQMLSVVNHTNWAEPELSAGAVKDRYNFISALSDPWRQRPENKYTAPL